MGCLVRWARGSGLGLSDISDRDYPVATAQGTGLIAEQRYGSATLMRGKSSTCRQSLFLKLVVYDRGSETPRRKRGCVSGKSKPCRASEWQSHTARALFNRALRVLSKTC